MRKTLVCSLLGSLSLIAACGSKAPKTAQEMGDRVLAALVAKDFNAAKSLFWDAGSAKSTCTDIPADKKDHVDEEFKGQMEDAQKAFEDCTKKDWTGAKITELKGGDAGDSIPGCGDKVKKAKDIKLKVDVGGKSMTVKIDDPVLVGDQYFLMDAISCKAAEVSCDDIYDNMTNLVKGAADVRDAEKEMFSGAADKKAQFSTMCNEMKGNPRFAPILDCVAAATTYPQAKACEDKAKEDAMKDAPPPPATNDSAPGGAAPAPAPAPTAGGDAPPPAPAPAPAGADTGDACAKYFAKIQACTDALPDAAKEPMKKGIDQMKSALDGRSDDEKKMACNAALGAAKQAMAQLCPSVNWD